MELGRDRFILRKLISTIVSTIILSALFAILARSETVYNQGNHFIGWFVIFFMYSGLIILLYGNLVSIGVEYFQRKWFREQDWLYVLIVSFFGLVSGVFFQNILLAFYGMFAATLYAIIDKWLYKRSTRNKSVIMFLLVPIVLIFIFWGYLQLSSPPMPPFTKEDAVKFVTSGEGTTMDYFPQEIGKWEGMISGYQVSRETNAKEIEDESYLVTFTEKWSKGEEKGSWTLSYTVERGSLSANGGTGSIPPYYE